MGAEQRRAQRRRVAQPVLMVHADGSIIGPGTMLDVSSSGARLKLSPETRAPDEFTLLLSKLNGGMRRHCVVAWRNEKGVGVRFVKPQD